MGEVLFRITFYSKLFDIWSQETIRWLWDLTYWGPFLLYNLKMHLHTKEWVVLIHCSQYYILDMRNYRNFLLSYMLLENITNITKNYKQYFVKKGFTMNTEPQARVILTHYSPKVFVSPFIISDCYSLLLSLWWPSQKKYFLKCLTFCILILQVDE